MIPAGNLYISGEKRRGEADVAEGAEAIMQAMSACARYATSAANRALTPAACLSGCAR